MSRIRLALFALLAACQPSSAPAPMVAERGAFVVRLGNDTVGVEQYARAGNRVEGTFMQRAPRTLVTRYVMMLNPNGTPATYEVSQRMPDGGMPPNAPRSAMMTFTSDSVVIQIQRDTMITRRIAGRSTFPYINFAVSMLEWPIAALRASGQDSAMYSIAGVTSNAGTPTAVIRKGTNRYWVSIGGFPYEVTTDNSGRVQRVDGSRTTQHIVAERQSSVDVAAVANMFAERERQSRAMGILSPRDTVTASIGAAQVWVDYGRPSARGRRVFGATGVLGDSIWRTGANAATQFRTSVPLTIAGQTIPAGMYTLWTMAMPGRYQLIFNRQVGQWGTEYKPEQDLARVPLQATQLAQPVDRFTIVVDPSGANAGVLKLRWDTTELAVPFTTP